MVYEGVTVVLWTAPEGHDPRWVLGGGIVL